MYRWMDRKLLLPLHTRNNEIGIHTNALTSNCHGQSWAWLGNECVSNRGWPLTTISFIHRQTICTTRSVSRTCLCVKLLYPAHCDWNCFWYFWGHNTLWNQPGLRDDTVWKIESEAASFRNTLAHTNVPGRVNSVWLSDSASECEVCHEFAFPWQQVCPVWRRAFNWWHACLECIMP